MTQNDVISFVQAYGSMLNSAKMAQGNNSIVYLSGKTRKYLRIRDVIGAYQTLSKLASNVVSPDSLKRYQGFSGSSCNRNFFLNLLVAMKKATFNGRLYNII